IGRHTARVQRELRPIHPENGGGDAATRDRRNAVNLLEIAELVQAPDRPDVEHHGAIAAAGKAESEILEGQIRLRIPGDLLWIVIDKRLGQGNSFARKRSDTLEWAYFLPTLMRRLTLHRWCTGRNATLGSRPSSKPRPTPRRCSETR